MNKLNSISIQYNFYNGLSIIFEPVFNLPKNYGVSILAYGTEAMNYITNLEPTQQNAEYLIRNYIEYHQ